VRRRPRRRRRGPCPAGPRRAHLPAVTLTWQHFFAGPSDRPTQNNLTAQPVVFYNLPAGWYLRSTASWNFDLASDQYAIRSERASARYGWPGGTTINLFVEPQWTVAHDGAGQPRFQVFAGLTLQFPMGR
jgi:hypothetical protein